MAIWGFLKDNKGHSWKDGGKDVSNWDDGQTFQPGEDGFSADLANDKANALGTGVTAYFIACPGWHERIAEEAADGVVQE